MAKKFEVRLLGTNHNSSHMHYEILKNGKRFIDGWVKTDKFRWNWITGYVEGNISYETKIVNYLTNQYKFIENMK